MRIPIRSVISALLVGCFAALRVPAAESTALAAEAVNALGLDLLRQSENPNANFLLSPYSIQTALAMTYAGADGSTKTEMAEALHFPSDEAAVHASFAALQAALAATAEQTQEAAAAVRAEPDANGSARGRPVPGIREPLILTTANRLYGQDGLEVRPSFLNTVNQFYEGSLERINFRGDPDAAVERINSWIAGRTQDRIPRLLAPGTLTRETTLVVVNAIYLKAPWASPFDESATQPLPFHLSSGETVDVPTMTGSRGYGQFVQQDGYSVTSIPFIGDLQFVILMPDEVDGLTALEMSVTPQSLASAARPNLSRGVRVFLPKLHLAPDTVSLNTTLQALGMEKAFDSKEANFDQLAVEPLFISKIFHGAFLDLNEKGAEAAAATVVAMLFGGGPPPQLHVDRPFLFAIQHVPSGACLFLGRVTDPR